MAGNSLYGIEQQQPQQNALMGSGEHPVISAARRTGVNPDQMIQAGDLNGLLSAAIKGNPQLASDHGSIIVQDFAQQFKRKFGMTERELPGSMPPAQMPNALMGVTGRPHPLQRPLDDESPQEYEVYDRAYQRQYGR